MGEHTSRGEAEWLHRSAAHVRQTSWCVRAGWWEYHDVRTILLALQNADEAKSGKRSPLLLDVGANLGTFTITAAALGYDVVAFEAMERNVAAIHQTLCWNPELQERVTLFPYALAEEDQSCIVVSIGSNVADGNVLCNEEEIAAAEGVFYRSTTHSVRLGDYLAGMQVDVMKIDVEGYEPHVIAGAGAAPTFFRPVHVQCLIWSINVLGRHGVTVLGGVWRCGRASRSPPRHPLEARGGV